MGDELELPAELVAEMAATFKEPETGRRWLHTRVADLGGETPSALVFAGRADEVIAVLCRLNLWTSDVTTQVHRTTPLLASFGRSCLSADLGLTLHTHRIELGRVIRCDRGHGYASASLA